ncbi:sulfatase family protein [Horticoccus sp. 23ND18S-11]|uniref:sulfatase family protein n=1 Tax=Horticoccus sp. 23ND18S-11 TaxID=3391832 RepID=UPI0039C9C8B8
MPLRARVTGSVLGLIALLALPAVVHAADRPPNLVFILTDNHGAWTLGCYGNPDIRTPHIDRLAAEGVRFTRALSSNPVCSPTRATFLTGLLPSQHGVHSFLDPKFMMGPEAYNTLREFTSIGEVLRDAGYVCGLSGKWHLGDNLKPSEGFTSWITKPDGSTQEFYQQQVIEDGKVRTEEGYTTDLWTRKGVAFIEQNQARPFFLFLSYNGPYALGPMMLKRARNRHAEYYRDKAFKSFPVDAMHPWQHANKAFHNQQIAMERVAAEISGVDDGVGEIMATLKRLGLDDNTVVVFTADQGWMGGQNGMWGMGDHFRPTGAHELMMQIPLIVRQPGRVTAGRTSDALVSNYDFMPTMLGHLGLGARMPATPRSPGRDFSPVFTGGQPPAGDNVIFYEMETTRAVRTEEWKYVARFPEGPFELYDLKRDPMERFNLYGQPGTTAIRGELASRLDAFFAAYADPQYDVWKGGRSKAKRHTP